MSAHLLRIKLLGMLKSEPRMSPHTDEECYACLTIQSKLYLVASVSICVNCLAIGVKSRVTMWEFVGRYHDKLEEVRKAGIHNTAFDLIARVSRIIKTGLIAVNGCDLCLSNSTKQLRSRTCDKWICDSCIDQAVALSRNYIRLWWCCGEINIGNDDVSSYFQRFTIRIM